METEQQCVYNTFRKNTDKSTVREFYVNDTPLFSRELVTNNTGGVNCSVETNTFQTPSNLCFVLIWINTAAF